MSNYARKLADPKWQRKRLEVLQRDDFKCTMCGCDFRELHVHHLKYTGEPHDAPNEDLQTMCSECHVLETIAHRAGVKLLKTKRTESLFYSKFSNNKIFIHNMNEDGMLTDYIVVKNLEDFLNNVKCLTDE